MRNLLIKLAAGAVGGVVGTWMIGQAPRFTKRLPPRLRPIMPKKDPGELLVKRAERIIGTLSPKLHRGAVQGLRIGYGLTWPLGLAALSGVLRLRSVPRTLAAGALLGGLVWVIGYEGWLPALGVLPRAHRVPLRRHTAGLLSHVGYGAIAALPLAVASSRLEAAKA